MNEPNTRAVVSAIIEKQENGVRFIYLQTRWKPQVNPAYSGLLEIPAGGIDGYENVFDALKREVKEETGYNVISIQGVDKEKTEENISGSRSTVFQPFVCQQMLKSDNGLPWVGFVFRCEVAGELAVNEKEAKNPRWVSIKELEELLLHKPGSFFPLQYPVLKYYVENS